MKRFLFIWMFAMLVVSPLFAGSFVVKGGFVRPTGSNDLFDLNGRTTTFNKSDLDGLIFEAGYFGNLGDFFSLGATVGYYNSDTNINDLDFQLNGNPLQRRVELRIIPIELAAEVMPAGHHAPVIPYVGGGVGAYVWKYEERGDFVVDRFGMNPRIVNGLATTDNTDFGWHFEGGVKIPVSSSIGIMGEVKYFRVNGDIGQPQNELDDLFTTNGRRLRLSQTTYTGGVSFGF